MGDFYYKCGKLDHVTGICLFAKPATITSVDGATAKLYEPWIRAEHGGDLLFVNTPAGEVVKQASDTRGNNLNLEQISNFPNSESLIHRLEYAI